MTKIIVYKNDEYKYLGYDVLDTLISDFAFGHGLVTSADHKLFIREEGIDRLIEISESTIDYLLEKHYERPSERQMSKNHGRYMKIVLGKSKYQVFILSRIGSEIVAIEYFRQWLINHNKS